jgi:hypothetical protein
MRCRLNDPAASSGESGREEIEERLQVLPESGLSEGVASLGELHRLVELNSEREAA